LYYALPEFSAGAEGSNTCLIVTSLLLPDTRNFRHGVATAEAVLRVGAPVSAFVLGSVVWRCACGCATFAVGFDANNGGAVRLRW